MKRSRINNILIVILPLIIGCVLYLFFRAENLILFKWIDYLGLSNYINEIRNLSLIKNITLPNWIVYNLPDGLWIFSLTYLVIYLWDFKINKHSILWIISAPIIGISTEFFQLAKSFSGTFDIIDLIFLVIASTLPFLINYNLIFNYYEK